MFPQTLNTIANCNIILRLWAYPHDTQNLPLDEHIGNFPDIVSLKSKKLNVFAQMHNLVQKQEKAM